MKCLSRAPALSALVLSLIAAVGTAVTGSADKRSSSFVLAGLKLLPEPWEKEANFAKLEKYARRAAADGAGVIVTPEGYLDGYTGNRKIRKDASAERYLAVGEELDGPLLKRVGALARELAVHLVVGFAERDGDRMFNTVAMFAPSGKIVGRYAKTHNVTDQEPFNLDGSELPVFDTRIGRVGMLICYDRQLPETSRILAIKGAELILIPAFGLGTSEIDEDVLMRARAYENSVYVAHVHPINTFIVDPGGRIIAQKKGGDEGVVMAEIVLDERIGSGPIRDRRPGIYQELMTPNPKRRQAAR